MRSRCRRSRLNAESLRARRGTGLACSASSMPSASSGLIARTAAPGAEKGRPRAPGTRSISKPSRSALTRVRNASGVGVSSEGTTKRTGGGTCASSETASVASTALSIERTTGTRRVSACTAATDRTLSSSASLRASSRIEIARAARSSEARLSSEAPGSSSAGENAITPALRSGTVAAHPRATVAPKVSPTNRTRRSEPHNLLTVTSTAATWSASV